VEVPSVVAVGEPAAFLCDVDLEFDNELYSVKWYKDSEEFYEVGNRQTCVDIDDGLSRAISKMTRNWIQKASVIN